MFSIILAQAEYNLIQPLPNLPSASSFPAFISYLIPFLLAFAGLMALLQIVFGGITYTASFGNETALKDAKDRIKSAILGLVLALSAYLILNTINPDLVSLRFFPEQVNVPAPKQIEVLIQARGRGGVCGGATQTNPCEQGLVCTPQRGGEVHICLPPTSNTPLPEKKGFNAICTPGLNECQEKLICKTLAPGTEYSTNLCLNP